MITGELKNKIDSLWEIFWTGGLTNPLDVIEQEIAELPVSFDGTLGLDYKSDGLYMDSEGRCCGMPHYYRENQKKLWKAQTGTFLKLSESTEKDSQNCQKVSQSEKGLSTQEVN